MTKESPPKLPKLTKKQRGFVDDYVESGNGTQSALKNYHIESKDPENVARSIASENLTKPAVILAVQIAQKTLKEALIAQGVTPEKIAERVNFLLDSDDGNLVDKGLKHSTNIYGVQDPSEKKSGNTYNFLFSEEAKERVEIVNAEIKRILTNDKEN